MREGFYRVDYVGISGIGFAVIVLETGMIVGADVMGGVYDGTYEWNEGTKLLEAKLKVVLPEGVSAVQGQVAPPGGLPFDVECSFPREPDDKLITAKTSLGDVAVRITLLRAFD